MDTGTLTADIIKTGVLESKNGKSWLNMLTGDFNFGDKVKYENGKFEIIVESSSGGNTNLGDELNNMNNKIDSITNAPTLELTGEQAFLYENNFTGTPTPPSIKISARVENVINPTYKWYFKRSGETSWTPIANNNYNYYNVFHDNSTIFNNPNVKNVTFKCSVGDVYDEFTIVKVSSGSNGTIGNDGISITEIQEQYYLSDSQQTLIGGTWQTTAPTWVKGKYIWTRTQFTYSNGNVTTTSPICVTGKDGADGLNGGVSVENVDVFYYQSTSATSLQGGSWTTTAPTWVNGKYVWSKTITYLDNGTQIESNPVCITGERGQNGIDGINGTNGKDGISTYFFIRYSEFSDGSNMTSTPNAKTKYMGTATTTNNVAPTTPSSYTWTLVKGADGKDGEQGVAGANGSSSYLHIKYSNDGRTFTANNGEELGTWIGTYVDTNPMDSSVFSDYNWVRFVGEDGTDAYTVLLSNENHTFPSTYEGNIENAITTTTVAIAYKGKTSITPTIGTLPTVTGLSLSKSGNTVTIVANKGTSLANTGTFKIPVIVDGITFEKTFSWSKSKNGLSGADGEDGYTVFLTNENFTFVADDTGNITKAQSTTTNILAYKGSKSLAFTIGTLPTVNGLTLSKTSDTITIKANTGTSLADVGSFDIIINADGKSFTKKFSWSKTKTGASGSNAKYVTVTGEQVFKYTNNFSGNPTPQVIKVTATPFNIANPVYVWEYKQVGSTTWQPISTATNANSDNYDVSHNNTTIWGSGSTAVKQVTIRCTVNGVSDEISLVKVSDGAKGDTGATGSSGVGISSITEYYAISSSNTTAPTSWSTTVPNMTSTNKYLWNYEVIKYTDNTTKETAKRVIGAYGDKGATGATGSTGATGNGISKITNYYLASSSSSGVTTSTSGWTTSVQSVSSSKKYLWNYEVITYTNGSTTTTTPCIIGAYGDTGATGNAGADAYTVILTNESHTFATQNNGNISSAISTTTQVLAYKGASSITPTIGTLPTVNGLTLIKSGTTITIQANTGTSLADSGSFNIPVTVDGKSFTKTFSWSKSKQGATGATGANGTNAKSVDIMASTQVFKSTDGGATFFPDTITLTPSLQNINFSKWQYSINGGSTWLDVVSGEHGFVLSGSGDTIEFYGNIVVSQTSLSFKSGATQTLNVSLASAPTKNQVVTINASGCTVDKTSLTFTPSNYNSIQTVTVGGSTVGNGTIVLSSPNVNSKTVNVTITQGTTTTVYGNIVTSASSLSFTSGSSTTFSVKLDKAPTNNQVVNISSSGCNVSTSSLTFTSTNYNTYQTITVSGTSVGTGSIALSSLNVATKTITVTINSSGGSSGGGSGTGESTLIIETANQGFNENGTLDGNTAYTHTETYIPFNGNTNATIQFGMTGWTRYVFYDSNKNMINTSTSSSAITSITMAELQSLSPNAIYVRISINQTTTITLTGGSGIGGDSGESTLTIETANQGFNTDGSLDGNTAFTHTETYIPFSGNTDKIIQFGTTGWTRAIFYDSNKNRIGSRYDSTSEVTYLSMSELQSKSPNAVYVRVSINKTTTITLVSSTASVTTMSLNDIEAQPISVESDSGKDSNYALIVGTELTISKFSDLFTDTVTSIVFKALTTDSKLYDTITVVKLRDASDIDVDNIINSAVNPLIKTDEQLTKRLDNAFSDDVITAYEKIQIASDLKEIDAQYDDMTKTVKSYNDSSITGIYNEYKVAYNNLHTALDPCLKNMDIDTKLSNSVVKDAFLLYGTYYSHLRSAIDDYIKNSFDITKSSITSLSNSVDIAISKSSSNEQNLNTIAKHMKFSDEGWLELFATTNGNEGRFKTKITDTKLSFTDNNQEVAYMSNQKLYINYAQINNDLQIGSIVATKSDKGGIVFKWQ